MHAAFAGPLYRRYVRHHLPPGLPTQRVKLLYDVWAYRALLTVAPTLLPRMLRIDWSLEHGHKPCEITPLIADLSRGGGGDVVEAGCWKGGTTSKLSLACAHFGYRLHVYDSFQGVPEWNHTYAAGQQEVVENVRRYGKLLSCHFYPGWFSETLRNKPVPYPVRLVYIDCDTPAGTLDVLSGVVPSLTESGVIYSQDYHLPEVRAVLHAERTWAALGVAMPAIEHVARNLARISPSFRPATSRCP